MISSILVAMRADELLFLRPDLATQAASWLLQLPAELVSLILSCLGTRSLARLAATCRALWHDAPIPPRPSRNFGPVELRRRAEARCLGLGSLPEGANFGPVAAELRRRAEARGLGLGSLPEGATSWVACLLKRDRRDAQVRQSPLAAGYTHSFFVDRQGRLLTCGRGDSVSGRLLLGHAAEADPAARGVVGLPTPVPSMQDRRIVTIATSGDHCMALSTDGEVYSWGDGSSGALGHGDRGARAVPSRIEALERIESIAAATLASAAVDDRGSLFTWGSAAVHIIGGVHAPAGLGYELAPETEYQATPRRVDALSQDRVMGVALGYGFTLVVTDAGAVFSFGCNPEGELGHGSLVTTGEVLPRRIDALMQTGRRFVAMAAGSCHALALTEEGELYGWGVDGANGHGREERTPQRVAALSGERVKLMKARNNSSCAVTEKGELFTWGTSGQESFFHFGHGVNTPQLVPRRVDALSGVKVAAVAIGGTHALAADVDGVVWGFGRRSSVLGLDKTGFVASGHATVRTLTPVPTLRVRVLDSP